MGENFPHFPWFTASSGTWYDFLDIQGRSQPTPAAGGRARPATTAMEVRLKKKMPKEGMSELPAIAEKLRDYRDLFIGNLVRIGEARSTLPDPPIDATVDPFLGNERAKVLGERFMEIGVDESTMDDHGDPVAVIKGRHTAATPIIIASEIDSKYIPDWEYHYSVTADSILGPGILDNAVAAAALASFADILKRENISFDSDLYLVGFANTTSGKSDYGSIDRFLGNFGQKVRGAVVLKGGELGRLNYFTRATARADITFGRNDEESSMNMIIVAHEVVRRLLALRLPQKPLVELVVGKFSGGIRYGSPADSCEVGFEVRSESNALLARVMDRIESIVESVRYEEGAAVNLAIKSRRNATTVRYDHPLTQSAISALKVLGVEPAIGPSFSELYYFLKRGIPAVTIGLTEGYHYRAEEAEALIDPMYKGFAQLLGIVRAIDEGACDE